MGDVEETGKLQVSGQVCQLGSLQDAQVEAPA